MATYNAKIPQGPNPLTTDVNSQFPDPASDVWLMTASGCVWPIMPGIALLYAGLSRRQNAYSHMFMNFMVWGATSVVWFLMGYSLVAAVTGGPMIGTLMDGGLGKVIASVSPGSSAVNEPVYCVFQSFFCTCTVQICMGGFDSRGRMIPAIIFSCIWSILVYDMLAYESWNVNGWLLKLGVLDFAGGNPVHIASGWGALAYALVLGKRRHFKDSKPHDPTLVFLGTSLICFGWFFFNSGTALNDTVRSSYAFLNTNLAASSGIVTYSIMHYVRTGRWSVCAACEGAIAGLVGITPAAGFVPFHFAVVTGIIVAIVCNLTDGVTKLIGIDEGLEVFNLHGIGGIAGGVCTAFFAADWVARLDGTTVIDGGWINGHFIQLGYNLAGSVYCAAWSFFMTVAILVVMNFIPGLSLRIRPEQEAAGYDESIMEEQLGFYTAETIMGSAPTLESPSPVGSGKQIPSGVVDDNSWNIMQEDEEKAGSTTILSAFLERLPEGFQRSPRA